jgi:hypothetical protein
VFSHSFSQIAGIHAAEPDVHGHKSRRRLANVFRYRASAIGSAVVDLIRSIANREVTFFSGTAVISFL